MLQQHVVTVLLVLVGSTLAAGQDCTSNTGFDATLILPPGFQPTLDGQPVPDRAEIRVLAPDGECVTHMTYMSHEMAGQSAPIWGEDVQFNPGPGIPENAPLTFQIKMPTSDTWYPATATYAHGTAANATGKYSTDELYLLNTLAVTSGETPTSFRLRGNYPNPFNPQTTIVFDLPAQAAVRIEVFNTLGEQVMSYSASRMPPGIQTLRLDASSLSSGVYFYRLTAALPAKRMTDRGELVVLK